MVRHVAKTFGQAIIEPMVAGKKYHAMTRFSIVGPMPKLCDETLDRWEGGKVAHVKAHTQEPIKMDLIGNFVPQNP